VSSNSHTQTRRRPRPPLRLTQLEDRAVPTAVWSQRGGDAAHTSYVDVDVVPAGITAAWNQPINYTSSGYWDQAGNREVAIDDTRVYRTELEGYWASGNYHVMAFDLQTGAPVWNKVLIGNGPVSAPSVGNGSVYINRSGHSGISGGGPEELPYLYSLNALTGTTTGQATYAAQWDSDERPTVEGNQIVSYNGYYGGMGSWSLPGMSSQWAVTGSQYETPNAVMDATHVYAYGSPGSTNTKVYSRTTGAVEATLTHPQGLFTSGPVVSGTGRLLLTLSGTVGGVQTYGVAAYDAATRAVLWTAYTPALVTGKAVGNGKVVVTAGAQVFVFDEATGAQLQSWTSPAAYPSYLSHRIVLTRTHAFVEVDGYIYGPSTIYAVNLTTGQPEWTFQNGLTDETGYSHVEFALSGGRLVLSHDRFVRAFAITVPNQPPVAANDSRSTPEDTAVVVTVLANDTDPDGNPLQVTAAGTPAHGTAAVNADGTITYTPAANYAGPDAFTYSISDGNGGTATGTVNVTVTPVNDPPTATADTLTVAEDDAATAVDVLANDSFAPDIGETLAVAAVATPAHGTATLVGGVVRYAPAANYTGPDSFTYTLSDGNGGTATGTVTVTVTPVNDPPPANDDAVTVAEESGATAVDVLANDSPNPDAGETLTVTAVTQPAAGGSVTLTGGVVRFTPAANFSGATSFTYTVADGNGGTATATVSVTVSPVNDPPVVAANEAAPLGYTENGGAVAVLPNLTVADVDSPTLVSATVTLIGFVAGQDVLAFTPAAGISGTVTGGTLTLTGAATAAVYEQVLRSVTYSNTSDNPDTAARSLTVVVNDGAASAPAVGRQVVVTAVNDAPAVAANAGLTVAEAGAATVTAARLRADDPDTPTSQVVFTLTAAPARGTLRAGAATLAVGGSFTQAAVDAGLLNYTHDGSETTADGFAFTVSDGSLTTGPVTFAVTVTPVNDPPAATGDTATTAEDTPLTVPAPGVLANDTDTDNAPAQLAAVLVLGPAHGSVTLNPDGGFTYTPARDYNGPDSFTYRASDGSASSPAATVSLTVTAVNDDPTPGGDARITPEDTPLTVAVLANDTDVDGDTPLTVVSVAPPAHGTATTNGTTVVYTPAADYNGTDLFTYTVGDGRGGTATAMVTVTVAAVNDPPAPGDDAATTAEDAPVTIDVLANDRPGPTDEAGQPLAVFVLTQPAHGSVTSNGATVTYTPAANYAGADAFTYTVTDGQSLATATVAVTVTPVDDAPVVAATAGGTAYTENAAAVAVDPGLTVGDVDSPQLAGATATVAGNFAAGQDVLEFTPVGSITGTYDSATGVLTLTGSDTAANYQAALRTVAYRNTSDAPAPAPRAVAFTVTDGQATGTPATRTVTVAAVNDRPAAGDDTATADEDASTPVAVLANDADPDGEPLSVVAVTQPAHGAVTLTGGVVRYTPAADYAGPDSFTYTVRDAQGETATGTVSLTVIPVNDPPTAAGDALTLAEDAPAAAVDVLANDGTAPDVGETLTVTAVTQPAAGGTVTLTGGTVRFTPAANFSGATTFTYTVSDGNGGTATATVAVTVTPVNDAPVAAADAAVTTQGRAVTIPAPSNDADADADPLTVVGASRPTHGRAAVTAAGVTYTPAAGFHGADAFTYTVSDGHGGTATGSVSVTVTPTGRPLAAGGPADGAAAVYAPDLPTGRFTGPAAGPQPFGPIPAAVRVAVGDVDGDGTADTAVVTGPGVPIRVAVVSGADGRALVAPFDPFTGDFPGGGFVAAADLDNDGRAEVVVTPDQGGGPRVSVFSLVGGALTTRANFFGIDDPAFRGGCRAALGDVNADGTPDLAVVAGFLGGPRAALFDGRTLLASPTRLVGDFFAFPGTDAVTLRNGAYVAVGDVDGDGFGDLVYGGGPGGAPRVFALSGRLVAAGDVAAAYAAPVANFFVAGDDRDRGGVRVAAADADGDDRADLAVGSGSGSAARVRVYLGRDFAGPGEPGRSQDLGVFGGAALEDGVYVG
jgi:hypothetical protein